MAQDKTTAVNLTDRELIDIIAKGDIEMPVIFKKNFKDTALYKKFLFRFSPAERRSILSGDYRGLLLACNDPAVSAGYSSAAVRAVPQNWNGNTYHGAPAVVLSTYLEQHPAAIPVFLSAEQVVGLGLHASRHSGIRVVHREGIASLPIVSRIFNLDDTDFPKRFPLHYKQARKAIADAEQTFREGCSVSDSQIREAVQKAADDLGVKTLCPKEFATLALQRRASRASVRLPRVLEANVEGDKAYGLILSAGKIELAAEKTLGLGRARTVNMDDVIRAVNGRIEKLTEQKGTQETRKSGHRI